MLPLECGNLLSYLDACIMSCVLEARLLGLWYVCFLELEKSMLFCVLVLVQGWLSVCSSIIMYAPSSLLCNSSNMCAGVLLFYFISTF